MKHVVFIPGLGADERLFSFIKLSNCSTRCIRWTMPSGEDNFQSYLLKLKEQIDAKEPPVLVGVSLGGIIAMELRELIPVEKTIIISSLKTKNEMPGYFNLIRYLGLNKLIPASVLKKCAPFASKYIADGKNKKTTSLFKAMIRDSDNNFIHRSLEFVLKWNRTTYNPEKLVHIHGTKDFVFPIRNISNCKYVIHDGFHDMIMSKAGEINRILELEVFE